MAVLKHYPKTIKIVQNALNADLTLAATWASATDLGELKGKPFVKLTWEPETYDSQVGKGALGVLGKFETSTLEMENATILTALQAMRGKNVSLQCTPQGTVSATNPILIVANFRLLIGGELNIGDVSFIKLSGEKPALDETELYLYDTATA